MLHQTQVLLSASPFVESSHFWLAPKALPFASVYSHAKQEPLNAIMTSVLEWDYFKFLGLPFLVVLKFIHVLLELLNFHLGCHLLLLRGLGGGLHLCDGPFELFNLRANLKRGGGPSANERA